MISQIVDALYVQLRTRPMIAFTVAYVGVSFVAGLIDAYRANRVEIEAAIDARTEFVRSIVDTLRAEEFEAAPFVGEEG